MSTTSLYHLTKEDIPRAVECFKDAFKKDPLWTEVFKNDPNRERAFSGFITCPLLYGLKFGKVYATSPEIEGVAVLVPGDHADMGMWGILRSGAMPYAMKMGKESIHNLGIVYKHLGPDRKKLMNNKPHAYLMVIGVASTFQGKGFGSKLMEAMIEEATREGLHIYLETETEANVSFYEKHGFSVLQQIVLEKLNVPMWEMERKLQ